MDKYDIKGDVNEQEANKATNDSTLDTIIKNAEFPDDYAAFEDENLDMIP